MSRVQELFGVGRGGGYMSPFIGVGENYQFAKTASVAAYGLLLTVLVLGTSKLVRALTSSCALDIGEQGSRIQCFDSLESAMKVFRCHRSLCRHSCTSPYVLSTRVCVDKLCTRKQDSRRPRLALPAAQSQSDAVLYTTHTATFSS